MAVLAGNADAGGAGANGSKKGKGKKGAGTEDGDEDASGDEKKGGCAAGDPVCPITGRMFTEVFDFGFNGPMPLRWMRRYNSRTSQTAGAIGFGWSFDFGWSLRARRRRIEVNDDWGRVQRFRMPPESGAWETTTFGSLRRDKSGGFVLRVPGPPERSYVFGPNIGDGRHPLLGVVDRYGNRIALQYDKLARCVGLTDAAERPYRFELDPAGRLLAVTVAANAQHSDWLEVVRYTYDDDGNLASAADAEGYVARYRYDGHLLIEHESVSGISYFYRYDGRGQDAYCVETWGEYRGRIDTALEHPIPPAPDPPARDLRPVKGIQHRRLTYVKADRYCESENGLGGVTRYFGDELGRARKIVNPLGAVVERAFDPATGAVAAASNEAGRPREVFHDASGSPTGFTDGDGASVVMFREDDGTIVVYDERNAAIRRYRHDDRGNPTFIEHPDGTREEFEHDDRGLLRTWIDRQGGITRYEHDEHGNAVRVVLANGASEENEFDYLGRRTAHVDLAGNRTEFRWDRRNEVIEKRHADGSTIRVVRDALRKPILIDEAGRITELEYGGIGWLRTIRWPGGESHELRYDVEGNLTLVRNARGQEFRQAYNVGSKCIGYSHFEDVPFEMGYDVAGNPAYVSGPLARVTFEHDESHNLVALAADDIEGAMVHGSGGFASLIAGATEVESTFDALGRVTSQRQGKHQLKVGWVGGQLAAISGSVGVPIVYERGPCAEVEAITVGSTRFRRNEESGPDTLSYVGDALVHRQTFNFAGRLVRQSIARHDRNVTPERAATSDDPGLLYWVAYEYDSAQMLRREWRSDGTTVEYELDAGDRIVRRRRSQADRSFVDEHLRYDAAGSPRMEGVTYDQHGRPLAIGDELLAYDDHSRLVRRTTAAGDWAYEWNALDQLVRVVAPDHVVEMEYDLVGRRLRKRVLRQNELVTSRSYVYANHLLLHEIDDLSGATRTYVSTNDTWETLGHVDVQDGLEKPCLYVLDPAGALDFAVDVDGAIVFAAASSVFGERKVTTARTDVTLRFANQHWDADVELVYNRYRWYDPRIGLYVTPDPWLLKGTLNTRDYVPNPTGFIDPLGLGKKHHGVGSGKESSKFHKSPSKPVTPHPGSVNGLGADQMSEPGHWSKNIPPGTPGHTPGFANCPPTALDSADKSGFQECIPENGGKSAQEIVDAAGGKYGCHTCGAKKSGYPDNADGTPHWTCDHQPPRCTYSVENAAAAGDFSSNLMASPSTVRLYPMCKSCSGKQAGKVGGLGGPAGKVAKGKQQMALNAKGRK